MVTLIFAQRSLITPVLYLIEIQFISQNVQFNELYNLRNFHLSNFIRTNFRIFEFFTIEVNGKNFNLIYLFHYSKFFLEFHFKM